MGLLAWVILSAATAAMAGAYAYAVGGSHGEAWAWISAASVVALLIAESTLAGDRKSCHAAIRWPALLLATLSLLSLEAGFLSSTASDTRAARQDAARVSDLRATRTTAEPAAAIRARLEAHEARHRGIKASWCGSTSTEVRTACDTWTALRADLATAVAGEAMPSASAPAISEADARADLLSRVIGGTSGQWADVATLLLAAALSFARLACAAAVFGGGGSPSSTVEPDRTPERVDVQPIETADVSAAERSGMLAEPAAVEPVASDAGEPAAVEPQPVEPQPVDTAPAVLVTRAARKVLQAVAKASEPQPDGSAIVPPGRISPALLVERTGLPRRQVADSLDALQRAGLLQMSRHGRAGTGFALVARSA